MRKEVRIWRHKETGKYLYTTRSLGHVRNKVKIHWTDDINEAEHLPYLNGFDLDLSNQVEPVEAYLYQRIEVKGETD